MYIRIVGEKHNVLFPCDRVVELEDKMNFFLNDKIHTELIYKDEEQIFVYAMNDNGKTIQNWNIFPEGK